MRHPQTAAAFIHPSHPIPSHPIHPRFPCPPISPGRIVGTVLYVGSLPITRHPNTGTNRNKWGGKKGKKRCSSPKPRCCSFGWPARSAGMYLWRVHGAAASEPTLTLLCRPTTAAVRQHKDEGRGEGSLIINRGGDLSLFVANHNAGRDSVLVGFDGACNVCAHTYIQYLHTGSLTHTCIHGSWPRLVVDA